MHILVDVLILRNSSIGLERGVVRLGPKVFAKLLVLRLKGMDLVHWVVAHLGHLVRLRKALLIKWCLTLVKTFLSCLLGLMRRLHTKLHRGRTVFRTMVILHDRFLIVCLMQQGSFLLNSLRVSRIVKLRRRDLVSSVQKIWKLIVFNS